MSDFLFQIGLSNACFALVLAIVAVLVGAKAKRPHVAHLLWLLVFVKFVTPPVASIPIDLLSVQLDPVVASGDIRSSGNDLQPALAGTVQASRLLSSMGATLHRAKPGLASIWLLGSVTVFAWSLWRVVQFNQLLKANTNTAPQELHRTAATIAKQLGLSATPEISITLANLSPMVWWTGGSVRVVIPTSLLDHMDARQWRWVLAHELAHVRRRDYLIRWLEWLACVLFWWHPVVWWAQRKLRAMEEICCDALVIATFKPRPHTYAESILTAVELLVQPAFRPPAMASEINSGGYLERRFKMIVSNSVHRSSSRWPQAGVLFCAMMVLPLGIASAQDYDAVAKRLKKAVNQGEITQNHADIMMQALKKSADTTGKRDEKQDFSAIGERIKRAVAAGKLTKEEAAAKWAELKKSSPRVWSDKQERDEKMDYEAIGRRIRMAVQEGKMTREEAAAKLAEVRKASSRAWSDKQERDEKMDYEAIGKKIRAAVQAGKLTGEEARKKWEAIKKDTDDKRKRDD